MTYEAFKRVPSCCGIWKKLKPINTDRWLKILLQNYLDEHTKLKAQSAKYAGLTAVDSERKKGILSGKPMVPGEDFTPFADGVWTFGHIASEVAKRGISPTFAQPQETIRTVADWWVADRKKSAIKAHHIVVSFDQRISHELHRRGHPVDAMLLSSFHETVSQYAARFYPGETLGWVAGCHHDRSHAHLHALIHPTTASGRLLRMSGLKENEPGEDKFDYLRTNFNTRSRQLFVGLTQQPVVSAERAENAAEDLMLLARHAAKIGKLKLDDPIVFAVEQIASWTSSREYATRLKEARSSANGEYMLATPRAPNPIKVEAGWSEMFTKFTEGCDALFDTAICAVKTIIESRNSASSYAPDRSKIAVPLPPKIKDYNALVGMTPNEPNRVFEDVLEARRHASDLRRQKVNAALIAYESSLGVSSKTLDQIQIEAAASAAQIALYACLSLEIPFTMRDAKPNVRGQVPHAIPSPSNIENFAEEEMAKIASIEANLHQPEDPSAEPGLLATARSPRFRELSAPFPINRSLNPSF